MNYNVYLNNELFIARPMLIDLIPETVDASLMIQNVVQSNGIMININANEKKKKKLCVCKEEDYAWNPSLITWECDKDCEIDEYLKIYFCVTSSEILLNYWWLLMIQ